MDLSVLQKVKNAFGFEYDMKKEQIEVIESIIKKKDVSVILPTGFGKSMGYIMPPLYLDSIKPEMKHIALIISPLLSLIEDQRRELDNHDIPSYAVTHDTCTNLDDLINADVSIIFTTPETLQSRHWRNLLLNTKFKERLCLIACDEAHCISEWGEDFRPEFREISSIRSFVDVPFMALTATATDKVQEDIFKYLLFDDDLTVSIAVVPNRPNIFLRMKNGCTRDFKLELEWYLNYLNDNDKWKKTIIFCRSYSQVFEVWSWLVAALDQQVYLDGIKTARSRKIEMFHSSTDDSSKAWVLEDFPKSESTIRVIVTIVAFGMGISVPDIDIVIHWGAPKSILAYWQEIGRCGRGGQCSYAIMYPYRHSLIGTMATDEVKSLTQSKECLRRYALGKLITRHMNGELPRSDACNTKDCHLCTCKACICCSFCYEICECKGKVDAWSKLLI